MMNVLKKERELATHMVKFFCAFIALCSFEIGNAIGCSSFVIIRRKGQREKKLSCTGVACQPIKGLTCEITPFQKFMVN